MFHDGLFSSPASTVSSSQGLCHTFRTFQVLFFQNKSRSLVLHSYSNVLSCRHFISIHHLLGPGTSQERRFKPRDTTGLQWTGCVKEAFISHLAAGKVNFTVESLFINRNFKNVLRVHRPVMVVDLNQHRFCQPPCQIKNNLRQGSHLSVRAMITTCQTCLDLGNLNIFFFKVVFKSGACSRIWKHKHIKSGWRRLSKSTE